MGDIIKMAYLSGVITADHDRQTFVSECATLAPGRLPTLRENYSDCYSLTKYCYNTFDVND